MRYPVWFQSRPSGVQPTANLSTLRFGHFAKSKDPFEGSSPSKPGEPISESFPTLEKASKKPWWGSLGSPTSKSAWGCHITNSCKWVTVKCGPVGTSRSSIFAASLVAYLSTSGKCTPNFSFRTVPTPRNLTHSITTRTQIKSTSLGSERLSHDVPGSQESGRVCVDGQQRRRL